MPLTRVIINTQTGEVTEVELTPEEIAAIQQPEEQPAPTEPVQE